MIPQKFIPAVEKGVVRGHGAWRRRRLPVVDMRVTLFDGSYHDVDSSDIAFQDAGSIAFKQVFPRDSPS